MHIWIVPNNKRHFSTASERPQICFQMVDLMDISLENVDLDPVQSVEKFEG